MNVFGIGLPELAVIAAIGLLVFGPKRLPELGKTLGRTLKGFQSASSEFEKELRTAIGRGINQQPTAILALDHDRHPRAAVARFIRVAVAPIARAVRPAQPWHPGRGA